MAQNDRMIHLGIEARLPGVTPTPIDLPFGMTTTGDSFLEWGEYPDPDSGRDRTVHVTKRIASMGDRATATLARQELEGVVGPTDRVMDYVVVSDADDWSHDQVVVMRDGSVAGDVREAFRLSGEVGRLQSLVVDVFDDAMRMHHVGPKLTCREVEMVRELLALAERPDLGRGWVLGHAAQDTAGDLHYELRMLLDAQAALSGSAIEGLGGNIEGVVWRRPGYEVTITVDVDDSDVNDVTAHYVLSICRLPDDHHDHAEDDQVFHGVALNALAATILVNL